MKALPRRFLHTHRFALSSMCPVPVGEICFSTFCPSVARQTFPCGMAIAVSAHGGTSLTGISCALTTPFLTRMMTVPCPCWLVHVCFHLCQAKSVLVKRAFSNSLCSFSSALYLLDIYVVRTVLNIRTISHRI